MKIDLNILWSYIFYIRIINNKYFLFDNLNQVKKKFDILFYLFTF